uniref:G-protein coupled receptors family 1 profile domain-containing protein n=1 Tax=Plectus sambesii TaxID=2011161 RepID=A0A914WKU5_9BILA
MRNISLDPDPESALWIGICFSCWGVIGIPANLFIVLATICSESLRSVPLNMFLFSLALGDLMFLVSCQSSLLWAIYFDEVICQVMGVGVYIFVLMSFLVPPNLAVCRYAVVCDDAQIPSWLRFTTRKLGIIALNGVIWAFTILYPIPLILNGNFGLDLL